MIYEERVRVSPEAPSASRVDRATGIREEVGFFGSGDQRMFGCAYQPLNLPPGGAVVICPSLHAEVIANYRREVLVARALAARGFAVQRFQFRGTGHSDGESSELTFETMRRDTMDAARHLLAAVGLEAPAFVGTRWGGTVAAAVAAGFPGAPLALWEPIVMPARWFRETGRAERIRGLAGESASAAGERGVIERLRDGEMVDILGYPIDPALYASSADRSLAAELGEAP
ncbi:MAG: alpha/beta fold hydrolase, partial [Actinomycetota bacterium]